MCYKDWDKDKLRAKLIKGNEAKWSRLILTKSLMTKVFPQVRLGKILLFQWTPGTDLSKPRSHLKD